MSNPTGTDESGDPDRIYWEAARAADNARRDAVGGQYSTDAAIEAVASSPSHRGAVDHTYHNARVPLLHRIGALEAELAVLLPVGRMYLNALDADPEHELLTLPEAIMVTAVRDVVEKWEEEHRG